MNRKRCFCLLLTFILFMTSVLSLLNNTNVSLAENKKLDFDESKVKITCTKGKVKLSWKKKKGVTGYDIKKRVYGLTSLKKWKTIKKSSVTDTDVVPGLLHEYRIRPFIKKGSKRLCGKYKGVPVTAKKEYPSVISDAKWNEVQSKADSRRLSIKTSPTTIVKSDKFVMGETYTGTAYYVSNHGNDNNDGLSPESPFATMDGLDKVDLKYGDAIFFERGSIFRGTEEKNHRNNLIEIEGLTFSAYGTGEKPCFYGSEENGAGAEKWSLYYDKDGRKIWKYYRDMTEVGGIVVGGNEIIRRDVAYWNGKDYNKIKMGQYYSISPEKYDLSADMPDMYCFPYLEIPEGYEDEHVDYAKWVNDGNGKCHRHYVRGPLYVRCDKGNPGEIYQDIEFIQPFSFLTTDGFADYTVYDNLHLGFIHHFGTGQQIGKRADYGVIQNCEVGFIGGRSGKILKSRKTGI